MTGELPFVRWAGISVVLPGEPPLTRRLYDHEINYVLSGQGILRIGNRDHQCPQDHCRFVTPSLTHSLRNEGDVPWVTLGIHFDWQYLPGTLQRFPYFRVDDGKGSVERELFRPAQEIEGWNSREQPVVDLRGRPQTRHFLNETVTAYTSWDEDSRLQAAGILYAALCQIHREVRWLRTGYDATGVGPDAQRRLNDALWLLENIDEKITVAQAAERVGWSADHLGYMMKSAFGVSPGQIQMKARLKRARELLRAGESIAEVARQCRFADTSHLARAFRKDSGITPREYSALFKTE